VCFKSERHAKIQKYRLIIGNGLFDVRLGSKRHIRFQGSKMQFYILFNGALVCYWVSLSVNALSFVNTELKLVASANM